MEKLKPGQVMEMLRQKGIEVSEEEAGLILRLLRKLAGMVVANYLKNRPGNDRKIEVFKSDPELWK